MNKIVPLSLRIKATHTHCGSFGKAPELAGDPPACLTGRACSPGSVSPGLPARVPLSSPKQSDVASGVLSWGCVGGPPRRRGSPLTQRRPSDVSSPTVRTQQRILRTGLRLLRARSSLPGSLGAETHLVDAPPGPQGPPSGFGGTRGFGGRGQCLGPPARAVLCMGHSSVWVNVGACFRGAAGSFPQTVKEVKSLRA